MAESFGTFVLSHLRNFITCASMSALRRSNSTTSAWTLNRRLKESPYMATRPNAKISQKFDYFLVIDFEATCDNKTRLVPQEIIEFPVLKVNGSTFETEAEFHQYVQPDVHKQLTDFCTELTGIIQDQVDHQPSLLDTLQLFEQWMAEQGLLKANVTSAFVTCGDWDLQTMLAQQCKHLNIEPPPYMRKWINIKKGFGDVTGTHPRGMMPMLKMLKLPHVGRHHSGIDDCRNIAAILRSLAERQYIFEITKELHS